MKRVSAYHHYKNERPGRFSRFISAVLAYIWQHKSGQAVAGGVRDPLKALCVFYTGTKPEQPVLTGAQHSACRTERSHRDSSKLSSFLAPISPTNPVLILTAQEYLRGSAP